MDLGQYFETYDIDNLVKIKLADNIKVILNRDEATKYLKSQQKKISVIYEIEYDLNIPYGINIEILFNKLTFMKN